MNENRSITRLDNFTAAYKNTASKQSYFKHYHNSYELCFFLNANIEVFIKDTRYVIRDGDIIFINENDIHRFIDNNPSANYNRFVVSFKREFILPSLKAAGVECILDYLKKSIYTYTPTTIKDKNEIEILFKSLIRTYNFNNNGSNDNFREASIKSYLVLILIRIYELIKNYQPEKSIGKKEYLVKKIIQFIDENYMIDITLDLLGEKFFINKFHISHIFKEVTGFSVIEYVHQRRILEVQEMLKNTKEDILDLCYKSGFNSVPHFYRVFKKISGLTPEKYRKIESIKFNQ